MSREASSARKAALKDAMQREKIEVLVLFGNNWHADHLRYATDFGIQEGQGIALVREDGTTTLILDDPALGLCSDERDARRLYAWPADLRRDRAGWNTRRGLSQAAYSPRRPHFVSGL